MAQFTVSKQEKVLEIWLLLFFLCSAAGWLWEVLLTICATGRWANRGLLHGPWLPIYGIGGVLLTAALTKTEKSKLQTLFLSATVGGAIEYASAWLLETCYHQRWWNYSGFPGSIHGRICLLSVTGFALAGCLLAWIAPILLRQFAQMRCGVRRLLCRSVSLVFALDWAVSLLQPNMGAGISSPL